MWLIGLTLTKYWPESSPGISQERFFIVVLILTCKGTCNQPGPHYTDVMVQCTRPYEKYVIGGEYTRTWSSDQISEWRLCFYLLISNCQQKQQKKTRLNKTKRTMWCAIATTTELGDFPLLSNQICGNISKTEWWIGQGGCVWVVQQLVQQVAAAQG